ncbi:hypothetical protein EW145_g5733 [Phellinidium pouzarii]|uniref:Acyl-protein thioesterase 1 n=1 Tax=Phellinidium pouzarii TaxID=167371 RepID=A0A4S4KYZ6_9AGAM|nr:hypothetical protein EW145_g5733 [Phellinidium pouzarii]
MHVALMIGMLQGLGQTTAFFELDIQFLAQRLPFVKWILPQARKQAVSYNAGERRPSWFNIWNLPPHVAEHDEAGIAESVSLIEQLILDEVHNGLDPRKILLVGFSQGAALCLMTALTTLHDIGGVGSLSGWIPHRIRDHILQNDPNIPIFWAHGNADTEIPLRYGRNSIEFLEQRLCMTDDILCYIEYKGLGHEITDDVLVDLARWIASTLDSSL